jgi:hypothetical protein
VHQPNVPIPRVTKLMAGKLPLGLASNNDRDVCFRFAVMHLAVSEEAQQPRGPHRQTAAFYG